VRWPSNPIKAARQHLPRHGVSVAPHLLGIRSLIICGEGIPGCVRASLVDADSNGFHVSLVEECIYNRAELTHKVNLFDMHQRYCDAMRLNEVVAHLGGLATRRLALAAE
jgi:maleamate amidohydrolase